MSYFTIRDVPIAGSAIVSAANMLVFTILVIGIACTASRADLGTDYSACKNNFV